MKRGVWLLVLLLGFSGCLEREETVVIDRDGKASVEWKVSGDKSDVLTGLQMPQEEPWKVRQWKEERDGKECFYLQAQAQFASIERYDQALRFGENDLQMETQLQIKRQSSQQYYFFKRLYRARDWWKFQRLQEHYIDKKVAEQVSEKGLASLADAGREKFLCGVAEFEIQKRLRLVSDGLGKAMLQHPFPVERITVALGELEKEYRKVIHPQQIERFLALEPAQQEKELPKLEQQLAQSQQSLLHRIFEQYPKVNYAAHLEQVATAFRLTEDLSDESFKVKITLPGKILLTNGAQVDEQTVYWEFTGKDLMNRDLPLEAVSVLEE